MAQLAVQLDGLPLALELAAARLDVLSLPALARRLDDRLRLLSSGAPDLSGLAQSVPTPKEEQMTMSGMSAVDRGGFLRTYDDLEKQLAAGPVISVPTITLEGDFNGAPHADASADASIFSGRYEHRDVSGGIGHNLPQDAPQAFAQAIVDVDGW